MRAILRSAAIVSSLGNCCGLDLHKLAAGGFVEQDFVSLEQFR